MTSADRWLEWIDGITGQVLRTLRVETLGDPVCIARRQSRVGGEDPQPPMSNDIHCLPELKLRAYNMRTSTVLLNKTPQLKAAIPVDVLLWPSFSCRDPVKKQQEERLEPPPMTVHRNWSITCLHRALLLLLPGSCAFPQTDRIELKRIIILLPLPRIHKYRTTVLFAPQL